MNDDEIRALRNVLENHPDGKESIFTILKKLGSFERGYSRTGSDRELYLTLGKREQGAWLLDCVLKANANIYTELVVRSKK